MTAPDTGLYNIRDGLRVFIFLEIKQPSRANSRASAAFSAGLPVYLKKSHHTISLYKFSVPGYLAHAS
jgi:hypothetical protein